MKYDGLALGEFLIDFTQNGTSIAQIRKRFRIPLVRRPLGRTAAVLTAVIPVRTCPFSDPGHY